MTGLTMRIPMWLNADDTEHLRRGPPRPDVILIACQRGEDVYAASERGAVDCLVIDARLASDWLREERARQLLASTSVVLRTTVTLRFARELIEIARYLSRGRVSLDGFDDLRDDLGAILEEAVDPTPELRLLRPLGDDITTSLRAPLVAATILGRRRTRLDALARACRTPPRTIEWRLHRFGQTTARDLLGWGLALNTVWRLDVLGWPLKRSALAAGFADPSTLSDYVERHVGQRPQQLRAEGGFEKLAARWYARIAATSCAPHPRVAPHAHGVSLRDP